MLLRRDQWGEDTGTGLFMREMIKITTTMVITENSGARHGSKSFTYVPSFNLATTL